MARAVAGLFPSREEAESAIVALQNAGFDPNTISVVMRDHQAQTEVAQEHGTQSVEGAVSGGVIGGTAGALLAATGAIGLSSVILPGIGTVIAGGIVASLIGGTAGWLVGGLVGLGIPKEEAEYYQGRVQSGDALVTVDAGDRGAEAYQIMTQQGAENTEDRGYGYDRTSYTAAGSSVADATSTGSVMSDSPVMSTVQPATTPTPTPVAATATTAPASAMSTTDTNNDAGDDGGDMIDRLVSAGPLAPPPDGPSSNPNVGDNTGLPTGNALGIALTGNMANSNNSMVGGSGGMGMLSVAPVESDTQANSSSGMTEDTPNAGAAQEIGRPQTSGATVSSPAAEATVATTTGQAMAEGTPTTALDANTMPATPGATQGVQTTQTTPVSTQGAASPTMSGGTSGATDTGDDNVTVRGNEFLVDRTGNNA